MRLPKQALSVGVGVILLGGCSDPRGDGALTSPAAVGQQSEVGSSQSNPTSQSVPVVTSVGTSAARRPRPALVNEIPVAEVDFKAQAQSIVEATRSGNHPERLTVMITPDRFNLARYRRNPAEYLNVVEPGRVNQPAEPGAGVPDLLPVGPDGFSVPELGSVTIAFRTAPRAPLSLTSLDMGAFANGQSAITVQADDEGIAQAVFTATRGTVADCRILVASPMAAYQRSVMISIVPTLPIVNPR